MDEEYQEVEIRKVRLGTVLTHPVFDHGTVLLLKEGTVLTDRIVNLLSSRGIEKIQMHAADAERMSRMDDEDEQYSPPIPPSDRYYRAFDPPPLDDRTRRHATLFRTVASRRLDEEIAERGTIERTPGPGRVFVRPRPAAPLADWRNFLRQQDQEDRALIPHCQDLLREFALRGAPNVDPLLRLVESQLQIVLANPEIACSFFVPPDANPYPGGHALRVCRLGMALAGYLGWSRDEVIATGIGGFCHDVGMLRLPEKLFRHRGRMDSLQRMDLIKHPVFSLDIMSAATDIHESVRYIVYQAHERIDGSGYPRGRTLASIHPAARLIGLVDSFVARVSDRLHRNPLLPHQAVLELIQETHAGLWESAMTKTLVRAVSLYPLGSYLELSDGRLARSLRVNEADPRRPLLEVWDDPAALAHEPGELVELSGEPPLRVSRAIVAPQQIT